MYVSLEEKKVTVSSAVEWGDDGGVATRAGRLPLSLLHSSPFSFITAFLPHSVDLQYLSSVLIWCQAVCNVSCD